MSIAIALLAFCQFSGFASASQPNIVVILADDLGFTDVGWHGSEIKTPVLDGLVQDGVDLTEWHGHSICTPSRSALLTGRYAFHTGMQHSYLIQGAPVGLPLNMSTFADGLKQAGYSTHMVGKWHLGFTSWEYTPLERGFDSYFGYLGGGEDYFTHEEGGYVDLRDDCFIANESGNYSAAVFVDKAVEKLRAHRTNNGPLFLYLAFQSVHSPIETPPGYGDRYPEITNKHRRTMAQMVSAMDDEIGRLVNEMKVLGLWNNTLLFFAADNGGPPYVANSNWPMRGGKWTMWQGGAHVAAFITHGDPSVFAGLHKFPHLGHHMDLLPTLFGAAGIKTEGPAFAAQCGADGERFPGLACPGNDLSHSTDVADDAACCAACAGASGCNGYTYHAGERTCWLKTDASVCKADDSSSSWRRGGSPLPPPAPAVCNARAFEQLDGINLWPYFTQQRSAKDELSDRLLVLNVDPTNTRSGGIHDAGGWAGYAAIRNLDWKLMLGDGGTPNGLCWPPEGQNQSDTCGYSGRVPSDLDTPHLYHLATDATESNDVSAENPKIVSQLMSELQKYIDSACTPLNMLPAGRVVAAAAKAAAATAGAWTPWEKCSMKVCRCEQQRSEIVTI